MWKSETIDEYVKMAIADILELKNTYEKVKKFESYGDRLSGCRIFLFDEECSNFDDSFKNCEFDIFGIYGVGDYAKTWILDSQHIANSQYICVGKTIDFDLNILTYLNKLMQGRKANINKEEFVNYLNYLKVNGFQCGVTTALMERATKQIDLNILVEMLSSFVMFDKMSLVDEKNVDSYLSPEDYIRIKQMYDMTLAQRNEEIFHFNILCCCVMKAFLIKEYDLDLNNDEKVDKFVEFCLNNLNCYLEKEIVLLSLYIIDDNSTKATFEKLKNKSNIINNILNITWDIFHIRLIENIMMLDNKGDKELIILSYFATADKGLIDAMKINPVKAVVFYNDIYIAYHSIRLNDVCKNHTLVREAIQSSSMREKKIKTVNFTHIRNQLEEEIRAHELK